jgi:glycosyltransferase involved in cell wall biosynthesis
MNVLHITLSYNSAPALGGPDLTVYKLCTELRRLGVSVDVVCTNLATKNTVIQSKTFQREIEGVRVFYLKTKKLFPLGKHSFGLFYVPELRPFIKFHIRKYDVLHIHGFRDYLTLIGAREAAAARVPFIINPRGTLPYQGHSLIAKSVYDIVSGKKILKEAAALIALSNREVDNYRRLGVDRSRIRVINNGIEPTDYTPNLSGEEFRRKHGINERHIVLYLGRIHATKGIEIMVRSVARLKKEGLDVAAVVAGPDEGYAKTLIRLARADDFQNLYFIPAVSGNEKKQVFASADALVYAAAFEGFGIVAFEGILSGVPTIVASNTGCGEIVARLDAGYLVKYGDVDGLAGVLRGVLEAPDKARARTRDARSRVISALSWPDIARQVLGIYHNITQNETGSFREIEDALSAKP